MTIKTFRLILSAFTFILQFCVVLPLWFYGLYQVLVFINAPAYIFTLFFVYGPLTFLVAFGTRFVEALANDVKGDRNGND